MLVMHLSVKKPFPTCGFLLLLGLMKATFVVPQGLCNKFSIVWNRSRPNGLIPSDPMPLAGRRRTSYQDALA